MIWSVVSKAEMNGCTTSPTFGRYSKELGEDRIKLAVVDEDDSLDFVSSDDIVLLRTVSERLIDSIKKRGAKTTAEEYRAYSLALDKIRVTEFLIERDVKMARFYTLDTVEDGKTYFVKPRYGNDSNVSLMNVCSSGEEVKSVVREIQLKYGQDSIICDNLDGREYTVACTKIDGKVSAYPIDVDAPLSRLSKRTYDELVCESIKIFDELNIKHHARIDFRSNSKGDIFAIDINLIPTIGQSGKWCQCFQLAGMSYKDSLENILRSAERF